MAVVTMTAITIATVTTATVLLATIAMATGTIANITLAMVSIATVNNNNNNNNVFYPIAIETAGSWDIQATELIEELGRRITEATEDPKETTYLFQRILITIHRGNALSFFNTFDRNDV